MAMVEGRKNEALEHFHHYLSFHVSVAKDSCAW
jgi:hypothetical protein